MQNIFLIFSVFMVTSSVHAGSLSALRAMYEEDYTAFSEHYPLLDNKDYVVDPLLDNKGLRISFLDATVWFDDPAFLQLVVASGADLDPIFASEPMPLIDVALRCDIDAMNLLLDNNINVNARARSFNRTALYEAATFDCADGIARLLAAGADKTMRTTIGETPYDTAIEHGHYRSAGLLRGQYSNQGLAHLKGSKIKNWDDFCRAGQIQLKHLVVKETDNINKLALCDQFNRLETLDLEGASIQQLESQTMLPKLSALTVRGTRLTDLSVLSKMPALRYLDLSKTPITELLDVIPLLGRLKALNLSDTKISDIGIFATLKHADIEYMNLQNVKIRDINPLKRMPSLTHLNLGFTDIQDLSALSHLKNLKSLNLSGLKSGFNTLVDQSFPFLEVLFAPNTFSFDDVARIHAPKLAYLMLSGSDIANLDGLKKANLFNLRALIMTGIKITDLSGFNGVRLPQLRYLDLRSLQITHIDGLANAYLPNLRWINLNVSQVSDLSGLRSPHFKRLEQVLAAGIKVKNLDSMKGIVLPKLEIMDLSDSPIRDIRGLNEADLPKLRALDLADTLITDICVLDVKRFPNLQYIDLIGAPIESGVECLPSWIKVLQVGNSSEEIKP